MKPDVNLIYTVSQKKNKQNYFCYNYVKLPPNLVIFGRTETPCTTTRLDRNNRKPLNMLVIGIGEALVYIDKLKG